MRTKWISVLPLLASYVLQAEGAPLSRAAARITLSNGQVVNVLSSMTSTPAGKTSTLVFIGEAGDPVSFVEETNMTWNQLTLSVSDGGRKLVVRFHLGFFADGLPGPAELAWDGKVYRWMNTGKNEATPQKTALHKAIAGLPDDLRKDLVTFSHVSGAVVTQMPVPISGLLISEIFADPPPRALAQETRKLTPDEITKIFQDRPVTEFWKASSKEEDVKTIPK